MQDTITGMEHIKECLEKGQTLSNQDDSISQRSLKEKLQFHVVGMLVICNSESSENDGKATTFVFTSWK